MARVYLLSCYIGLVALLAGCEPAERAGDPSVGQALYQSRCQSCHGERGEKPADADAGAGVIRDQSTGSIVETLKQYQDNPEGAPWWTTLKSGLQDQEIRDLVAYCSLLIAMPSGGDETGR